MSLHTARYAAILAAEQAPQEAAYGCFEEVLTSVAEQEKQEVLF
jgi:hypothetical protein